MGIQGLLPLLKSIQNHRHISEFAGQTLAVDSYVWLHRGAYACAPQLVKGEPTTKYVEYAMHRVRLLLHHGVTPYMVFDGGPLPAKKGTESERKKKRDENLARATALTAQGKHTQARDFYTKCVDVTPEMAYQLIKALRAEGVKYVVAPYEADPQLAYLERHGIVQGIVTEDSDLLVFGCKNVIFKLDSDGTCVNIRRDDFGKVGEIEMAGWGDREFREMAMLSGCDYLPSIPGLGLKTSHKLLRKYKSVPAVLRAIPITSKTLRVPPGYLEQFHEAERAFLYQRVWCPVKEKLVMLGEVPVGEGGWDEAFIGECV
ncbi:hypothetical protein BOTBODRAFT_117308 [Botryobasidium botryosum FD-172 SS1]|uniref:Uncharacterized protein n=1 Tax=Botryobasidium botryosum (strain FD-172 SS1) TaxID=930990 RepID=A0A067MCQ2_BOTB1|nr:hypothetical protein BOTBODRAFT_117308 [Botryobasidium botryosum FD-172 SS1]